MHTVHNFKNFFSVFNQVFISRTSILRGQMSYVTGERENILLNGGVQLCVCAGLC